MFISTGLIKDCKSVDELAFVLSHEISHLEGNHLAESLGFTYFIMAMGLKRKNDDDELQIKIFQILKNIKYLPKFIYEADKTSVDLCKTAGFDPILGSKFYVRGSEERLSNVLKNSWRKDNEYHETRTDNIIEEEKKIVKMNFDSKTMNKIQGFYDGFNKFNNFNKEKETVL